LIGEWTAPVVLGVATFDEITAARANTSPQTGMLVAEFTSPEGMVFEASRAVSVTPVVEATLPIRAHGPLAIDEATNTVYVVEFCSGNTCGNVIQAFDGTTNQVLEPILIAADDDHPAQA